jgi:cell division protein FtsB
LEKEQNRSASSRISDCKKDIERLQARQRETGSQINALLNDQVVLPQARLQNIPTIQSDESDYDSG